MSLLGGNFSGSAGGGGGGPPSGTVLFVSGTAGPWEFPIPVGVTSVFVEGQAAGGAGAKGSFAKSGGIPGFGGGGGAYFKKTGIAVTGGSTVLTGVIGLGGNASGGSSGTSTTLVSPGCTANGGTAAIGLTTEGAGGTASGGDTNTTGHAGGLVDAWDGGGAPPTFIDQIAQQTPGTSPGGGGAGGTLGAGSGANGQIRITVT